MTYLMYMVIKAIIVYIFNFFKKNSNGLFIMSRFRLLLEQMLKRCIGLVLTIRILTISLHIANCKLPRFLKSFGIINKINRHSRILKSYSLISFEVEILLNYVAQSCASKPFMQYFIEIIEKYFAGIKL